MRKYILYSTILSLFLDTVIARTSLFDIKTFYFILVLNFPFILLTWDLKLPRFYMAIIGYVWVTGLLEVVFGPDRVPLYLKEVFGITITSFYFYLFFKYQKRSTTEIFDLYARASAWVSLVGIFLSLIESLVAHAFVPVKSILIEPSDFAIVMLPAFYYYASMGKACEYRWRMWVILASILLSVSSVGMLGIFLSVALLFGRRSWGLFVSIPLVGALFVATYTSSEHFRLRVNDTVQSISTLEVQNANASTYALVSNAYVAARALQERPFFGYGIGGHVVAHSKYLGDLLGPVGLTDETIINLNDRDANSLFLRTMSECGIIGIILIASFIVKFWTSGNSVQANVSTAIFIYFCMILLRSGKWFDPEIYFFVWIYVFTSHDAVTVDGKRGHTWVAGSIKVPQITVN